MPALAVDIGVVGGDQHQELDGVVGAVRLADGRIAVANSGTSEVRFYDPGGRYLGVSGRTGSGPGEYRSIVWIDAAPGGSLLVYDRSALRLSVLAPDGRFTESYRMPPPGGWATRPLGRFADGTLLVAASTLPVARPRPPGISRDSTAFFRYWPRENRTALLGTFPIRDVYAAGTSLVTTAPFSPTAHVVVCDSGFFYGFGGSDTVAYYGLSGRRELALRGEGRRVPVRPGDVTAYKTERLRRASAAFRPHVERMLEEVAYPTELPSFAGLAVDARSRLWVAQAEGATGGAITWRVRDRSGGVGGSIRLPARSQILQIDSAAVVTRWQDDLAVEHVRVYRLPPALAAPSVAPAGEPGLWPRCRPERHPVSVATPGF